ncbi:hypothetical protein [Amycolatopsis sp. lyj-346]|uniref:hypothetical protein n=1 Tax=Amycolatopsis sp. lyj-346 TaxID=2789289 RepID=UPI00397A1D5E
MVRELIDGLRAVLEQALCTLATNKSLAVLSRAGFSSEDLATVAVAAARTPGRPLP